MDPAESTAAGADVPVDVRALVETVAERLNLGTGTCRLIVDLQDGRVQWLTRQERMKGTALERF